MGTDNKENGLRNTVQHCGTNSQSDTVVVVELEVEKKIIENLDTKLASLNTGRVLLLLYPGLTKVNGSPSGSRLA